MVRDLGTVAAAQFAIGVIGWVVVAERPPENQGRIEEPEASPPTLTFD